VSWKEKVLFLVSRIESRMRQACWAGFEAAGASAVSAKQGVRACYFCPPFVELLFVFFSFENATIKHSIRCESEYIGGYTATTGVCGDRSLIRANTSS
jgi:hypothetical protein